MTFFVCPKCRTGVHNLCSKAFCDCQHKGEKQASSTPNLDEVRRRGLGS